MPRSSLVAAFALAAMGAVTTGCHRSPSDAARRESEQATAEVEAKAHEASLTSATLEPQIDGARAAGDEATRARGEVIAAFRLEQSDYRGRLQSALDLLDGEVTRARRAGEQRSVRAGDLRARRALLKADLVSVDRSTEQDWATLRTKVERDLEAGKPGAQLPPRTDRVPGEAL
jgi:hypothetical protein